MMTWLNMEWFWLVPLFWLFLTVVLVLIELETFNLVSIWFALGSIAAMFVSLFNYEQIIAQLIVFVVVSFLTMITTRRFAVNRLKVGETKTNVHSLIGRHIKVTKTIDQFNYGEVKVNGNYWTAKSLNDETILENETVEIVEVSGVKLVVVPVKKSKENDESQ